MKAGKINIIKLVLQPYSLDILKALEKSPKRFNELGEICKNERTLSKKLKSLQDNNLIENIPVKIGNKYGNSYIITDKGKNVLKTIRKL